VSSQKPFRNPTYISPLLRIPFAAATFATALLCGQPAHAQSSSSSSSTIQQDSRSNDTRSAPTTRIAQPEAGGSAITLETSEPLFYLAAALNACGYDASLDLSAPIRTTIRQEVNQALTTSAEARDARDALCTYIQQHTLADSGRNLAQYVSLAVYLKPPPELTPIADETELPADSTQVVNILPLLRTFGESIHLHAIWVNHRADYEDLVNRVHDPLTKMVLNTNIYLGLPVSSYDGRRFLILLEPMLAPTATNARIYANDFLVVASPAGDPLGAVHMDLVRHTYLHYEVEPLVYARASAMDRLLPLLKSVQDAPLEFTFKSDIVALITECLIKAIEARTMDVGLAKPKRPDVVHQRADLERFDAEIAAYDKQAEIVRHQNVQLAVRQGWVLVDYFYDKLGAMEKDNISLKEDIGEMVYGMDVQRELHKDLQVTFLPQGSNDLVRRVPRQLKGLDLAEMKLLKGDVDGAQVMADDALKANPNDVQANYLAGRIELIQGNPDDALVHLNKTLTLAKDPRTLAWAHIYLGRLWDIARDPDHPDVERPERPKAIAEYKAALTVRDALPDTKAAAEKGIKEPFALPKREQQSAEPDDAPLDPSGKAEKDAYRPPPRDSALPR
jgi:tetratricopeptide (TPR) repeat protein